MLRCSTVLDETSVTVSGIIDSLLDCLHVAFWIFVNFGPGFFFLLMLYCGLKSFLSCFLHLGRSQGLGLNQVWGYVQFVIFTALSCLQQPYFFYLHITYMLCVLQNGEVWQ